LFPEAAGQTLAPARPAGISCVKPHRGDLAPQSPAIETQMKHDFAISGDKAVEDQFLLRLETETVDCLKQTYGDGEGTKAMIFLFVNRAYETHMAEPLIGEAFGRCIVRVGTEKKMKIPLSTYWNFLAALLVSYIAADNHSLQRADWAKYAIPL
jgi:hypothetical protein